jgi:hypothetical protein
MMKRLYEAVLQEHFQENDQMALMPGPRQCGKTTVAKLLCKQARGSVYLNWDFPEDRELILGGPSALIERASSEHLGGPEQPFVALDEIHKLKNWKNYLKGYYDATKTELKTLITGSAKLDVFKKAGDSLMGRYFLYHMHPLSVGELLQRSYEPKELSPPKKLSDAKWKNLLTYGGFPEPYMKADKRFLNRWSQLRFQQLFAEDIQAFTRITELDKMEIFAKMLQRHSGDQMNYSHFGKLIQVDSKTIRNWVDTLKGFYYCFTIQPWHKNVSRALIKEPKLYLWDWSRIEDMGKRHETMMALHLLKAVNFWQDIGLGEYALYFLRDKDQREVDFLVVRNEKPWMLIEVKSSGSERLSPHLQHFQKQVQAQHVLQVAFDLPYEDSDFFSAKKPVIVSARTFLSQLV